MRKFAGVGCPDYFRVGRIAQSVGVGRVKLGLSRGFPRCPDYDVNPYGVLLTNRPRQFMGGSHHLAG
jgi:hypothetical protein